MSDRIGIMRAGRLVQVGTPDEIYNQPKNRFVSEFMGGVNVIQVEAAGDGKLHCSSLETHFIGPEAPQGFASGHLVIRPEYVRFLDTPDGAENHLRGVLYNDYSLGSRIQYHVKVGGQMFAIEKLREQRYHGKLDDSVIIGWDSENSVLVPE